jgi:amino acid permease
LHWEESSVPATFGTGLTFSEIGPGAVLVAYAVAGVTIYGVMQTFAELLVIFERGSFVSYTREFMGDTASAGIGWAYWANWLLCSIGSAGNRRIYELFYYSAI